METHLTPEQRGRIGEKIMELGNLVFLALVIAQLLPGPFSNSEVAVTGIGFVAGAHWLGTRVMKGGEA